MKADATQLRAGCIEHFRDQSSFAKDGASTLLQSRAGTDERFPNFGFELTHEKDFNLSACLFAMSDQARRNHARVVHDDDVVGTKMLSELIESRIAPLLSRAIEHEHPRGVTLFERCLRDELGRKLVIKLGDSHQKKDVRNGRP